MRHRPLLRRGRLVSGFVNFALNFVPELRVGVEGRCLQALDDGSLEEENTWLATEALNSLAARVPGCAQSEGEEYIHAGACENWRGLELHLYTAYACTPTRKWLSSHWP